MVPPEGIDKIAPTTLPADFGEWDSGDNPETQPADFNGFDRFPGSTAAPKPPAKTATARVAVLPAAERPQSAPPPPPRKPAKRYPDPEPVFELPQSKRQDLDDYEQEDESKAKRKKMFVGAAVVALLLAGGSVGYLKMSSKPAATNQPVATQTSIPPAGSTTTLKPTAATTAAPVTPTTTEATETPAPEPGLSGKQSEMMNRQLNAPSRISGDLKALGSNQAAPAVGFSAAGMEGMGGSAPVFNSANGPKVKVEAPKKVSISAGVAVGLLTQKTQPIYPPIAKSARIQGTVVIQATISKSGAVENTRVVSGPTMLRQSALDAVKSWRYRPYLLDGQPVEVDTTVNVVFNLGN